MNTISDVRHIWFDFTDTIASMPKEEQEKFIYGMYAEVAGKPLTEKLIEEYKKLYESHKSHSAVFAALGKPAGFLSGRLAERVGLYKLTDEDIPAVLKELKNILPISVFSNSRLETLLPKLGIDPTWFMHILGPDRVKNPKPAPDGFLLMCELSGVLPSEILFIGDNVEKDILPAKEIGITTGLLWTKSNVPDFCFTDFRDILKKFSV